MHAKPEPVATPFDNRSFTVGDLTVESSAEGLSLYGTVDLQRTTEGLARARRLADCLTALCRALEDEAKKTGLPDTISVEAPVLKANPFAAPPE